MNSSLYQSMTEENEIRWTIQDIKTTRLIHQGLAQRIEMSSGMDNLDLNPIVMMWDDLCEEETNQSQNS